MRALSALAVVVTLHLAACTGVFGDGWVDDTASVSSDNQLKPADASRGKKPSPGGADAGAADSGRADAGYAGRADATVADAAVADAGSWLSRDAGQQAGQDAGAVVPGSGDYVVFAWNDLGMHCLNPSYDKAVILPPYNDLVAQVVKRGNPPQLVNSGVTVSYRLIDNTYSYGKDRYGEFWDNAPALFGATLARDTGLNLIDPGIHNGLAGDMVVHGSQFEADGIPATPVDDFGTWNPYQVAEITVKDGAGAVVAQTRATVPTSDEINCAKCHGNGTMDSAFDDILARHDAQNGTSLQTQKPVLCASCHGSPALGQSGPGSSGKYLSQAVHGFHAKETTAACYDCHPGGKTQCSRSLAHTSSDGNCTTCHGSLAQVASSIDQGRIPWAQEPKCSGCHSGVVDVDTGSALYRKAQGHGGLDCSACHGSPHAMVPSREASDNYQAVQYQGKAKTIGSCGACHSSSRGETGSFADAHGGTNPEARNACHTCHTVVPTDTTRWPHAYTWKAR